MPKRPQMQMAIKKQGQQYKLLWSCMCFRSMKVERPYLMSVFIEEILNQVLIHFVPAVVNSPMMKNSRWWLALWIQLDSLGCLH